MPRVIIHAGFHKTGTTTAQQILRINREALNPFVRIVLRPRMKALCRAARAFSATRSQLDLALVKYETAELAQRLRGPHTTIVSSEDLSGHMPGHRDLKTYSATPILIGAMHEAFRAVLPKADVTWAFGVRQAKPWILSCHGQHLKSSRITLGPMEFLRKFRGSGDLEKMTDKVAKVLADDTAAQVVRMPLEDTHEVFGPADTLMKLAEVPRETIDRLATIPRANVGPSEKLARELLDLNRSDMDESELRAAKAALLSGNGG